MTRIEIVTIGDELVEGRLVDTNAGALSDRLMLEGLRVAQHTSVGDEPDAIVRVLREAAERAGVVLVSGGLGPTGDDLTAESAARAFSEPVVRHPEALDHVQRFFADRGREMSPNNAKQADLPRGAQILPNPRGTAVGFSLDAGACRLYFMPGVPREIAGMFEDAVLPQILRSTTTARPLIATLKLFGRGESDVAQALDGLGEGLPAEACLTVQYRASFPEIHVRLVLDGLDENAGAPHLEALVRDANGRIGRHVFASGGPQVAITFPEVVIADARRSGARLATAEAASRGVAAQLLSGVPDSGDAYLGGVIAATAAARDELLGAAGEGDALAKRMASAIRDRLGATHGVATVGSAADEPAAGASPPGTLWVGIATPDGVSSRELFFPIEAERFRVLAAYAALGLVRRSFAG